MSYRTLCITGLSIEAILMGIALFGIGEDASLGAGIAWGLTQMPSLPVANWLLSDYVGSDAPFYVITFILQSVFLASVLCLIKWTKERLAPMPQKKD
ncbi:MAG: hypothetical protein HYX71_01420 [Opitutae bacterium]|nr:hypothetical protein [Opitutae bacterium]